MKLEAIHGKGRDFEAPPKPPLGEQIFTVGAGLLPQNQRVLIRLIAPGMHAPTQKRKAKRVLIAKTTATAKSSA